MFRFECDCTGTGFTGALCDTNIDECLGVHCRHNSTCIDGVNAYHCRCHPGYTGLTCEHDIDECLSSPCRHGHCWQNSDQLSFNRRIQYLSAASTTTRRDAADRFIDLSFSYSFNYEKAAGYWCECQPGYTGTDCETEIDECEGQPCGRNGRCIDMVNRFECECYPGYTGTDCSENIDECQVYRPCAQSTKCIDLAPDYSNTTAG